LLALYFVALLAFIAACSARGVAGKAYNAATAAAADAAVAQTSLDVSVLNQAQALTCLREWHF